MAGVYVLNILTSIVADLEAGYGCIADPAFRRLPCYCRRPRDIHYVHSSTAVYDPPIMSYHVIHIPFLAAAVGTVQFRSLIEPIRKIIARLRGHFVQGKAVDICMDEHLLEVQAVSATGQQENFYLPSVT